MTTEEKNTFSIIDLAETVKDLVRIIKLFPNYKKLDPTFESKLDDIYKKASIAKNRLAG